MLNIASYDTVKTPVLFATQNTVIWTIRSLFSLSALIQPICREVVAIVANVSGTVLNTECERLRNSNMSVDSHYWRYTVVYFVWFLVQFTLLCDLFFLSYMAHLMICQYKNKKFLSLSATTEHSSDILKDRRNMKTRTVCTDEFGRNVVVNIWCSQVQKDNCIEN